MRFAHVADPVVNGVRDLDLAVGSASSISRLVKSLANISFIQNAWRYRM